jgi:hypothetical protein
MDVEFTVVLKETLILPPRTAIWEPSVYTVHNASLQLYSERTANSTAYQAKASHQIVTTRRKFNPYSTRSTISRYDFSLLPIKDRYLLDGKSLLLEHLLDMPGYEAANVA